MFEKYIILLFCKKNKNKNEFLIFNFFLRIKHNFVDRNDDYNLLIFNF